MKIYSLKKYIPFLQKYAPLLMVLLVFALTFLDVTEMMARPGGGHSSGGGGGGHSGGGSSGGGSGGDAQLIFYFLQYAFPAIPAAAGIWLFPAWGDSNASTGKKIGMAVTGLVLMLVSMAIYVGGHFGLEYYACGLILCALAFAYRFSDEGIIQQLISSGTPNQVQSTIIQTDDTLNAIVQQDPNFSKVLFLDYVRGLFHQYYFYGNDAKLSLLTPFIEKSLLLSREKDIAETGQKISELVIANVSITKVQPANNGEQRIWVAIESNYTLTNRNGVANRMTVAESWQMARNVGVSSLPPQKMQVVSCPNCGAAADFTTAGNCRNCNTTIQAGAYQWYLNEVRILNQSQFETKGLGTYVAESGTNLRTITHPDFAEQKQAFATTHRISDINNYLTEMQTTLVVPVFMRIYEAWAAKKWQDARHLLTDFLYESQNFWMDMYRQQGITNRLEKIQVSQVIPVKIETDKYYEAITFRIYARCLDYTLNDKSQKVIGGDDSSPRSFTEYWTFIRRTGINKPENPINSCPNCGAPVDKMGMTGECGYCNTKVSSGDFSWVLAYMTQDEAYRG